MRGEDFTQSSHWLLQGFILMDSTKIMTAEILSEQLKSPLSWKALHETPIPLSLACRRAVRELYTMTLYFIVGILPLSFLAMMTYAPLMHFFHEFFNDQALRATMFLATVVIIVSIISRVVWADRAKRLLFLLRMILPLASSFLMAVDAG